MLGGRGVRKRQKRLMALRLTAVSSIPNHWMLALVLGLALAIRLSFFLPHYQASDVLKSYAPTGHQILTGEYQPGAEYDYVWFSPIRLGVVVPVAALTELFGYSLPHLSIYPLICSILTLLFVYGIGLRLERQFPHAALLSVLFAALYPLLVTQAPQMLPDTPRTLFATAAVYFFVRSRENDYDRFNLMACGFAIGLSYLCQIQVFFLLPGVAVWLVFRREVRVRQLYALVGIAIAILLETVVLSIASGQLFLRLSALFASAQDVDDVWVHYPGISRYIPGYWEAFVSPGTSYFVLHGVSGWIGMAAVIWAFAIRQPLLLLLALCWVSDSAVLNFSPMPSIETRYLLAGIPLLCVLAGALLARMMPNRAFSVIAAIMLLVSSMGGSWLYRMTYVATSDAYESAASWLDAYPALREGRLYVTPTLEAFVRHAAEYDIDLVYSKAGGDYAGAPPEYALCLFTGYYAREDLPDQVCTCSMEPLERLQTGSPELTRLMGRYRPKIGFEAELVLYRLADCSGS